MVFNSELLRSDMIKKRVIERTLNMDLAASEIGIGKATVSRIESNKTIDVTTLCKVCDWLKTNPSKYFIVDHSRSLSPGSKPQIIG